MLLSADDERGMRPEVIPGLAFFCSEKRVKPAGVKSMHKINMVLLALLMVVGAGAAGCQGPLVRTDLDRLLSNPDEFKGKSVLVTTDIARLLENQDAYYKKKVELTGYVEYLGHRGVSDWGFLLKDEAGKSLLCHEQNYRVVVWDMPVAILRRAERERAVVTVVGRVERGGRIELDWIEFQDLHLDTDYRPHSVAIPW